MSSDFLRAPAKKSLLSLLKNVKNLDARFWSRFFDGVMFKSEMETFITGDDGSGSGGGTGGIDHGDLSGLADQSDHQWAVVRDGSRKLTADWDAGSFEIRAKTLESDVATGTSPLTVASTTKVSNLNADLVDGKSETAFVLVDGSRAMTGDLHIHSDLTPALYLQDSGSITDYTVIQDYTQSGIGLAFRKFTPSAAANMQFDPLPVDNSSGAGFLFFRTTDTSGSRLFTLYLGNNTATKQHEFNAGTGDVDLCQQGGGLEVGAGANHVDIDSSQLLSFQGTADIAAATDTAVCLTTYIDVKARNTVYDLHGSWDSLATGQPLDAVPTDLIVTAGTSKLVVVINAGSDISGSITVTGISVDKDTGAETGADTDTLTIDALTTDNSDTDASSNVRHSFIGAYITSKWFKGSVTLSTTNLTLTDVDVYQVAFEQWDNVASITLDSFDITALATNSSAWLYAYLYTLEVAGDKCDITRLSTLDLPAVEVSANKHYRLRRGALATTIDGTADGIWVEMFPGPLANNYWEDINIKIWATLKHDVYGEAS